MMTLCQTIFKNSIIDLKYSYIFHPSEMLIEAFKVIDSFSSE